jgi:DNA-binding NarL/FixJ family response regulator
VTDPVRVVIGEDDVLLREGIASLLTGAGFDVVAQAGDAEVLLRRALAHKPDVAIVDINMPPGYSDDGLQAPGCGRAATPAS